LTKQRVSPLSSKPQSPAIDSHDTHDNSTPKDDGNWGDNKGGGGGGVVDAQLAAGIVVKSDAKGFYKVCHFVFTALSLLMLCAVEGGSTCIQTRAMQIGFDIVVVESHGSHEMRSSHGARH
jgi:hypothetical protein